MCYNNSFRSLTLTKPVIYDDSWISDFKRYDIICLPWPFPVDRWHILGNLATTRRKRAAFHKKTDCLFFGFYSLVRTCVYNNPMCGARSIIADAVTVLISCCLHFSYYSRVCIQDMWRIGLTVGQIFKYHEVARWVEVKDRGGVHFIYSKDGARTQLFLKAHSARNLTDHWKQVHQRHTMTSMTFNVEQIHHTINRLFLQAGQGQIICEHRSTQETYLSQHQLKELHCWRSSGYKEQPISYIENNVKVRFGSPYTSFGVVQMSEFMLLNSYRWIRQLSWASLRYYITYQILGKGRQAPTALWAWSFHCFIPLNKDNHRVSLFGGMEQWMEWPRP